MNFRLGQHGVLSAIAAMAFAAAMLSLAPSAAQAHAGHFHSHPTTTEQSEPDTAASTQVPIVRELTESRRAGNSPDDRECAGRGCCASGPCTGCHGVVLTTVPDAMPPMLSTLLVIGRALPRAGPDIGRLRRPPKTFV
jgi:hypothetical protein